MGWLARAIDAGQEYRKPLVRTSSDDVFLDIGATRAKSTKFWVQLVAVELHRGGRGHRRHSTPAVIGAMIIAPLATPIYGVALATSIGSGKIPAGQHPRLLVFGHRGQHPHRDVRRAA